VGSPLGADGSRARAGRERKTRSGWSPTRSDPLGRAGDQNGRRAGANKHGPVFGPRAAPETGGCNAPYGTAHRIGAGQPRRAFNIAPVMRVGGCCPGRTPGSPPDKQGAWRITWRYVNCPLKAPLRGMGGDPSPVPVRRRLPFWCRAEPSSATRASAGVAQGMLGRQGKIRPKPPGE